MMKQVQVFAMRTEGVLQQPALPVASERLAQLTRIPKEKARAQSTAAELLLCWAVRHLRPPHIPIPPVRRVHPQGKPYFPQNPDFCFSISHAGSWAVLAVADVPIGIDVERVGPNRPRLVSRYFSAQEQTYFFSLPQAQQADAFYRLWVLKEAAVKALGAGMHRPLASFSIQLAPPMRVDGIQPRLSPFLLPFAEGYRLGGCVQTAEEIAPSLRLLTLDEVLSTPL